jgi:hypothetical protein
MTILIRNKLSLSQIPAIVGQCLPENKNNFLLEHFETIIETYAKLKIDIRFD